MIGTTEVEVPNPETPEISADESEYLLNAANAAFVRQNRHEDIRYSWAGVRPLFDNGSDDLRTTTRDYVLEVDRDGAPLLNVLGGKITTARYLAEDAMVRLGKATGRAVTQVTRERPYPGGHLPLDYDAFIERSRTLWPFLGAERTVRMVRAYGSALGVMMAQTESESAMGRDFGHGLTALEVDWLIEREWARTAEDVLFRRTKLGLAFDQTQTSELAQYMEERVDAARD